jgi:putative dimethyl sulfoxide reductase chaperone
MMNGMANTKEAPARARIPLKHSLDARGEALALAALYRMLALAFSNPEPELARSVASACAALKIALKQGTLPVRLVHSIKEVDHAWRQAGAAGLEEEYSRLFLGTGTVPLREGGYGDGMRFAGQPTDLADVSGFYLAFGFALPESSASPPDFLGAELEFMSLLNLKLALAYQRRRHDHARITRSAMARFLEDHLGRWAEPFAAALADADAAPAYRTMGRLLARAVETDCLSLKVRPSKARAGSGKDPIGGEELVCPFAGYTKSGAEALLT